MSGRPARETAFESDLRDCIAMAVHGIVGVREQDGKFVVSGQVKGVGPDAHRPPFAISGAGDTIEGAAMHCRIEMKKIRREPA